MRHRMLIPLLAATLLLGFAPAPSAYAASCQFSLGFATLQAMIPGVVGSCLENEHHNPQNGDGLQATTGGLLVWRKADNFTAFTDGARTWVHGPLGLQTRLNDQRFSWEWNPDGLAIVPPPSPGERCHTAGLSLTARSVNTGDGSLIAAFSLNNDLGVACTLFGYVGAQLLDAQSNPLPTRVVRGGGSMGNQPGPSSVTVPAGGSATFLMHWEDAPAGGDASCPTSDLLKVTPPGEFDSIIVPASITACGDGRLDVSAVRSSSAATTAAPSTAVSSNWAGYAATGGTFTGVTGTWTVPAPTSVGRISASATWVGIGGISSRDLIQAGTEDVSFGPGQVSYDAWIERLPRAPVVVPLSVNPGDSVTVSIGQQAPDQWLVSLTNNTSGQRYQTTLQYASSLSSAEWIEEAPSTRRRVLPLDSFGTVRFSGGSTIKDGRSVTIAQAGAQPITLVGFSGNVLATPTDLTASGSGFSVTRTAP